MANNDLNEIRIFTKVAQLQSFTRAADMLGIEKSTVSSKINQLEKRLGIRLLHRTTRSVNLTEAGSQYLYYCEQALSTLEMGNDYIAELSHTPIGSFRVSTPLNFVEFVMPSLIIPFLERYPQVKLNIIQTSENVDLIKDGFDMAIRPNSEEIEDSSLIYRKIFPIRQELVASRQFIEKFGLAKTPHELNQQPSVGMIKEASDISKVQFVHWGKEKVVMNHCFTVNSINGIKAAIKAAIGVGILPERMIRNELAAGEFVKISEEIIITSGSLYLVYPSRSGQPAKLKAFTEALLKWGQDIEEND